MSDNFVILCVSDGSAGTSSGGAAETAEIFTNLRNLGNLANLKQTVTIAPSGGAVVFSGSPNHRRHELLQGRRADLHHRGTRLLVQQVEHPFDARLAEGAQPPEVGPADAHGARPAPAP